ncbi:MAG: hypothetical protein KF768_10730 [Phycisphaeraceae bacterium]|nr:hypothetical protein [Phycisphaeraceae bacterium]
MTDRPEIPPEFAALDRLRRSRVRPERDLTLQRDLSAQLVLLRRLRRSSAGVAEAWNATVPDDLLGLTSLRGLASAVLSVGVPDDGVRFRLDRWLRAGGQIELSRAARTPIRKVKIVIERPASHDA